MILYSFQWLARAALAGVDLTERHSTMASSSLAEWACESVN
jgi:hypothetical protein